MANEDMNQNNTPEQQPQQPYEAQPQQPYEAQPQQPYEAQPQQPYGAQPQQPYGAQYQQPYGAQPQQPYGVPGQPGVPYEQKSKMAAGLLGIFLGGLGIHNFYLGNTGKALAQLLITVCTCGFGAAISGIWGLIEGIMILAGSITVDGKGVPLKE